MRPHQVAEHPDLFLGVELGPQVHEVQESPQREADDEVLAVIEGQDAAGMLLRKASREHVAVALRSHLAEGEILLPLVRRVGVLLALAIAVLAFRAEVEDLFQFQFAVGRTADPIARVAHRLDVKAHPHPVGAGLLHDGVGEPAHIQHDLGVLERPVVTALSGEETFDTDLPGAGLVRPLRTVSGHEPFAVVLVHPRIDALLGVGGRCNQLNPKAFHGRAMAWGAGAAG